MIEVDWICIVHKRLSLEFRTPSASLPIDRLIIHSLLTISSGSLQFQRRCMKAGHRPSERSRDRVRSRTFRSQISRAVSRKPAWYLPSQPPQPSSLGMIPRSSPTFAAKAEESVFKGVNYG